MKESATLHPLQQAEAGTYPQSIKPARHQKVLNIDFLHAVKQYLLHQAHRNEPCLFHQ